jgi:hypothetical protein
MASSLGAPQLSRVPPWTKPPRKPGYGEYCFKATVTVTKHTLKVARVTGYDTDPGIAKVTEQVSVAYAHNIDPEYMCSDAALVMLPSSDMECTGQVFWEMLDGGAPVLLTS